MLIVRLEEDYKIQFTGDQIAHLKTVGDTRSALQAQGPRFEAGRYAGSFDQGRRRYRAYLQTGW